MFRCWIASSRARWGIIQGLAFGSVLGSATALTMSASIGVDAATASIEAVAYGLASSLIVWPMAYGSLRDLSVRERLIILGAVARGERVTQHDLVPATIQFARGVLERRKGGPAITLLLGIFAIIALVMSVIEGTQGQTAATGVWAVAGIGFIVLTAILPQSIKRGRERAENALMGTRS